MKLKITPLLILAITLLTSLNVVRQHFLPETNVLVYTGHLTHNYKNESQTEFENNVDIDATITTTYSDIVYASLNNSQQHPMVVVNKKSDFLTFYSAYLAKNNNKHITDFDSLFVVLPSFAALDVNQIQTALDENSESTTKPLAIDHIDYWQTVYSIESKQGKLLFRPRNKARNCDYTTAPCGHHQLTVQALKDIGCKSLQCRKDRLDFKKSLELSKKLLVLNEKRLKKHGISNLEDYQKYLIHQQGASGIKHILAATQGKNTLSKRIKKNMANNSPFSYKELKRMDSKVAANRFMQHWEEKWIDEKRLIIASQATASTNGLIEADFIPKFDDKELSLALNIRF